MKAIPCVETDVARRMNELREVLLNAATREDLIIMVRKLVEKAKEGNLQAVKLYMGYVLGRPLVSLAAVTFVGPRQDTRGPGKNGPSTPTPAPAAGGPSPGVPARASKPVPPELDEKLLGALSEPLTAAELDEARRTSILTGRPPSPNGFFGARGKR